MSPKRNNYPVYPDSWDSSSASVHPLLIQHVCVLNAELVILGFPLGVFNALKQNQGAGYVGDTDRDRPCCSQSLVLLKAA